jgi:signal transduction histidine kinase
MLNALHTDDRTAIEAAIETALQTGTYEAEYRLVRPDGRVVWITDRGRIVPNVEGPPERMVGISRDVTADKEAEQEREGLLREAHEACDRAERESRLRDEFLATLSHELRTPMNAILGWLSILDNGKPIRDVYSALDVIRRNANLQAKLIDDLLDMNRLISGNIRLDTGTVDLGALLQTTILGLRPAADARGVQVIASVDSGVRELVGDARRLQQVLWNLVHNAIKFTSAGGRVAIRIQQTPDHLQFIVQDNGRGISPEFLPHVFERFRQEDGTSSRSTSGLGLGLSIAKHLVELHGGTIEGTSAGVGHGATFVVQIPTTGVTSESSNVDAAMRAGGAFSQ